MKKMKEFSYEEIKTATNDFSLSNLIGKGSHGAVYRARLGRDRVAIKKPFSNDLDDEIDILSSVESPNLVNLVGICRHGPAPSKLLVTELMPNGSLHDLLHARQDPPSWPRRLLIALQVARAVLSLHGAEPAIIHRDLKPANVLFDKRWNAKLSDFSLAVRACDSHVPAAGTLGYLDPEYVTPGKLSVKRDVFSFGVLLLEIVSLRKAMDVEREQASIVDWAVPMIEEGRAAEVCGGRAGGRGEAERVVRLAARCVSEEEEGRPEMGEVVEELLRVLRLIYWPRLHGLRTEILQGWRRCIKKKVTSSATKKIVCKDHVDREGGDGILSL